MLEHQNRLLKAVISASEVLLGSLSFENVIDGVLSQMGKALKADRCALGVFLPSEKSDELDYLKIQHEWVASGVAKQIDHPELAIFAAYEYREFMRPMLQGLPVTFVTAEIEDERARRAQESTGAKSQFHYPILVEGKLWGTLRIDDCKTPRVWTADEIVSVSLLSAAITSVVKRERLVEARINAERDNERAQQAKDVAVTTERNRMAREIHDTLAQGFTGVIMQSQAAEDALQKYDHLAALHHVNRTQAIAKISLQEARRSVFALRPSILENRTLGEALAEQVSRTITDSKTIASLNEIGKPLEISNLVATELLRIAQEAVNNALRHSQSTRINVTLTWPPNREQLLLSIVDDGCGFDPDEKHPGFGLISMRERTDRIRGKFELKSIFKKGTDISVFVDLRRMSML